MTLTGIGPQHKAPSSREQLRDSQRRSGRGPKGTYGIGLLQPARKARQQAMEGRVHRDEHGAYTLVGRGGSDSRRRIWLAGISAQRGW